MFATKCPGQDSRYWKPEDIYEEDCPNCGNAIEFWKTDIRLRCEKCKSMVVNPRFNMGCAEWCSYAEQCLGDVVRMRRSHSFLETLKDRMKEILDEDVFLQLLKTLALAESLSAKRGAELIVVSIGICIKAMRERWGEKEAQKRLEVVVEEWKLPHGAFEKAYQAVLELERGELENLTTRILQKSWKLQPIH